MFEDKIVVCFGLGKLFHSYIARLSQRIKIEYVCDNDSTKWNKRFFSEKILCISPIYLKSLPCPVVIITVDDIDFNMQMEKQLSTLGIEHYYARDVLNQMEYIPENVWLQELNQNRIRAFVDLDIHGTTVCNFHCDYCYVWRKKGFGESKIISEHSVCEIRKGLSRKKLGGTCFVNMCAQGETLLAENIVELIYELIDEGHYVSVVTNGTVTNNIERIIEFPPEFQKKMFFKISFHYLELQKRKLFDVFWSNVEKIKTSECSYTLEITPYDGLVEHISDIRRMFDEKANGAMPHISFARDSTKKGLEVLTDYELNQYRNIWGQFDSKMFDLKSRNYGEKITQFCYAGVWSYFVNSLTGDIKSCYRQNVIGNIFDPEMKEFPNVPVAHDCHLNYCYNNHAFMSWGNIPEKKEATYLDMRDRVDRDGEHWVKEPMYSFMNDKLYETNFVFGDIWEDYIRLFDAHRKPAILLFNSPDYRNIGDMAIALGEKRFLKKFFPEYDVIEIACNQFEIENRKIVDAIKFEDIIFITGGGNIGSLWLNIEDYITKIITDFKNHKVFIFPQTLYFGNDNIGKAEKKFFCEVVKNHGKVFIAAREKISLKTTKEAFENKIHIECTPDMALYLPVWESIRMREGALICVRSDKESIGWKKGELEDRLKLFVNDIESIDRLPVTSICLHQREEEVEKVCNMLSAKELVITDRLHCMILCALTETPCVALNNVSNKVYGVYQWIADLPYIKYVDSINSVEGAIAEVIKADRKFTEGVLNLLQFEFETYANKLRNEL